MQILTIHPCNSFYMYSSTYRSANSLEKLSNASASFVAFSGTGELEKNSHVAEDAFLRPHDMYMCKMQIRPQMMKPSFSTITPMHLIPTSNLWHKYYFTIPL